MRNIMRLGDVASYINGFPFKPSDWSDMGVPIIRIQDLTGNGYQMNRFDGKYDAKYEVRAGDVLISWSASLGVYVWKLETAVLNQHIFKVRFDKVDVDKDFFVYQVECLLKKAARQAHGATMRHLTKPVFDGLPFYLPPKEEQKRIAVQLNAITRLISIRQRQAEKLDELVKARFVEMFGNLRKNDKNWPMRSLVDFAKIDTQMIHDLSAYEDYPHIGIDSIEKGTGHLSGYHTVKEDGVISGKYLFTPKHIIYSKIRPNLNKVALPDFTGVCSADAYPILPESKLCDRVFLAYVMRSELFLSYILAFANRTNLPKVNKKQVEGFSCPLPPLPLQNAFATFVHEVDREKEHIQRSAALLETLKRSLMQQYFG